jgi:hypothetical protein
VQQRPVEPSSCLLGYRRGLDLGGSWAEAVRPTERSG